MTENNQIRLGYLIHTNLPEYTEVFLSRSIGSPISRDIEFQRKFFTHTHTHTHTHTSCFMERLHDYCRVWVTGDTGKRQSLHTSLSGPSGLSLSSLLVSLALSD